MPARFRGLRNLAAEDLSWDQFHSSFTRSEGFDGGSVKGAPPDPPPERHFRGKHPFAQWAALVIYVNNTVRDAEPSSLSSRNPHNPLNPFTFSLWRRLYPTSMFSISAE